MGILNGKNIVIIGGATGIGRAMAVAMAEEGANITIGYHNSRSSDELVKEIKAMGREALAIQVDVTDSSTIRQLLDSVYSKFGTIDVFCNNSGVSSMSRVIDMTEADWDLNMDVNAKGVFLCCREEAKSLIHQGFGKIINTASMASKRGAPLLAHYCASKYAVIGFSKSLALELAPHGITVNSICPGMVKTAMQEREICWEAKLRGISEEEVKDEYLRITPLGRLEEPEDVANVAVFLASAKSDFMTGQAINITGGIETN